MTALRIRYQTFEFDGLDIHLRTLHNLQQFEDLNGIAQRLGISSASWPIFGVIWPSGQILAHLMLNYEIDGIRILEVGCGIGLASLVLNHRQADITATDYHPEAEGFLQKNIALNEGKELPFIRTGWSEQNQTLGQFDLVIGSDILYEREHVDLLSGFIHHHSKPHSTVLLVDPGRGHHAQFSKKMVSLGYSHSQSKPENVDYLAKPFKGQILRYHR